MSKTMGPNGEPLANRLLAYSLLAVEILRLFAQFTAVFAITVFRVFVPQPRKSVRGQVVLVTGAGHGLGRLLALNFGGLGAKVVLWDINKEQNEAVAEDIRKAGGQAWAYLCDVSNEKQVETVGQLVRREVGDVTVLINNAGVLPGKPVMYLNSYQIRRTLEINTLAHFWTIRQFLPNMLEVGQGHIVAVSSIAGIIGCANLTDYCASKFGVVGMMSSLREDLYAQGKEDCIQLTVACPSVMDTGLVQRPKTRFPTLFPILKVETAAEAITDGILREKRLIIIPQIVHFIYKISNLFPTEIPLMLQRFLGYTIDPNIQ